MTWNDILNDEKIKEYLSLAMNEVDGKIGSGETVFPPREYIFRAMDLTPFDKTRVVILGQDPYHELHQANGLAFSVFEGVRMPPSLRNMFKELQDDLGGEMRTNTDLGDWAEQGVLLLNTALSVVEGQANSMAKAWEPFTDRLIELIDENKEPVIFVLWGGNAKKKKALIKNNRSLIIENAHPSPLSAYRGFFGSKPYSRINAMLISLGQNEIKWT